MHKKGQIIASYFAVALGLAALGSAQTSSSAGEFIHNNTPGFVTTAKNLGPVNPSETIDVAVWLNPHNRAEMDTLAEELYDPTSSNYHNWLKPSDIVTKFAPTAQEAQTVGKFLSAHNLPVVAIGPDNFMVHARGTVAAAEKAFNVKINNFEVNGQTYRANTTDPYVEDASVTLMASVSGLDNLQYQHPNLAPSSSKPSSSGGVESAVTSNTDSQFFESVCFNGPKTETISSTDEYGYPATATYKGNSYVWDQNNAGCGYTPPRFGLPTI
jgi:subtilase family serine protease